MKNVDNFKKREFTEDEFFHLGFRRFLNQKPENVEKVLSEKLVDFSMKNQVAVEPNFFLEMTDLGKEVLKEKMFK